MFYKFIYLLVVENDSLIYFFIKRLGLEYKIVDCIGFVILIGYVEFFLVWFILIFFKYRII